MQYSKEPKLGSFILLTQTIPLLTILRFYDTIIDMTREKTIIGTNTLISVAGIDNIPAKVDTGADSSAIWASNQRINNNGQLEFTLFAPESPLYTGEVIVADNFRVKSVRSSLGDKDVRYQVQLLTDIMGRKIKVNYSLADRSKNTFPVLIGRKTLSNKFVVDVTKYAKKPRAVFDNTKLNEKLQADPQKFHQEYFENNQTKGE